jgi:hypothetical protein
MDNYSTFDMAILHVLENIVSNVSFTNCFSIRYNYLYFKEGGIVITFFKNRGQKYYAPFIYDDKNIVCEINLVD